MAYRIYSFERHRKSKAALNQTPEIRKRSCGPIVLVSTGLPSSRLETRAWDTCDVSVVLGRTVAGSRD